MSRGETVKSDKSHRASASQFFVAAELCRRNLVAVITLGNCPNTDILVSNKGGTRFVHVQVKTFVPGGGTCSVGQKAEQCYGPNFFWVLAGIRHPEDVNPNEYFIIPSKVMARRVREQFQRWRETPGKMGQAHNDTTMRTIYLPPKMNMLGWSIEKFRDRWDLITKRLDAAPT